MEDKTKLVEFCTNSMRFITFMFKPPSRCPYKEEQLLKCQNCGYYQMKKPSYFYHLKVRKLGIL